MTTAPTAPTPQAWFAPPGLIAEMRAGATRRERVPWSAIRTLAVHGANTGNTWRDGSPLKASFRSQTRVGLQLGVDRRTVSRSTCILRDWSSETHGDLLETTREGSHSGCLAYRPAAVMRGGRHIRKDVLESLAWKSLTNCAAGLYLGLRELAGLAVNQDGLDCRIKGRDMSDGTPALADRFGTSPTAARDALRELEAVELVRTAIRYSNGRPIGIRVWVAEEAPGDAHVPTRTTRWMEGLATKIAVALEELRQAAAAGSKVEQLSEAFRELKGRASLGAAWTIAELLHDLVRRKGGRRYAVRQLARAVARHAGLAWRRQAARIDVSRREIIRQDFADAAEQVSRPPVTPPASLVLDLAPYAGLPHELPEQGPASTPEPRETIAAWRRAKASIERAAPNDGHMLTLCRPVLEQHPADGRGPVLWVCASSLLIARYIAAGHLAELRRYTGCRVGARELPEDVLAARGPP